METILREAREGQRMTCTFHGGIALLLTVAVVAMTVLIVVAIREWDGFNAGFLFILVMAIIFAILWYLNLTEFIRRFSVFLDPKKSEWWQDIVELGYDQEIIWTIDSEINHPTTILWQRDDTFLQITPKWLIAIGNSGWVAIRKRSDLVKVSRTDGTTTGGSMSPTLDFQFTDGKKAILWFGWDNNAIQREIMFHLKEIMPHVQYEDLTRESRKFNL